MCVHDLRPLPRSRFELEPTPEQIASYLDQGFLVVDRLTTDDEIEWLAELAEIIFDTANSGRPGAPVDRSTPSGSRAAADTAPPITQAFFPEGNRPELLHTVYNRNARRFAAALLAVDVAQVSSWSHMIRKPPGAIEVPWHQDEAYWDVEYSYHAVGSWLALHDVPADKGAMQFAVGSHRGGVVDHRPLDGDVARHLLTVDVELTDNVTCPLPAGGATFHHPRTLHSTTANSTDRTRTAFPAKFQTTPRRRPRPADRPWVTAWRAATGSVAATGYTADGEYRAID